MNVWHSYEDTMFIPIWYVSLMSGILAWVSPITTFVLWFEYHLHETPENTKPFKENGSIDKQ